MCLQSIAAPSRVMAGWNSRLLEPQRTEMATWHGLVRCQWDVAVGPVDQ